MPRHKSWPRAGRKYPRKTKWMERRDAVFARAGKKCEVSGEPLGFEQMSLQGEAQWKWTRAADHIFAERFIRQYCAGADPHVLENLIVITPSLHARKTKVEWKLFKGDRLAYLQELRYLGFDQVVIDNAWKAICASIKVPF